MSSPEGFEWRSRGATRWRFWIAGYEFPSQHDRWDGNWLVANIETTHEGATWRAADPCITTEEVADLAAWLRELAAGRTGEPWYEFLEPELKLECLGAHNACWEIAVHLRHALLPPARVPMNEDGERVAVLRLEPTAEALLEAARYLDTVLARFPPRGL